MTSACIVLVERISFDETECGFERSVFQFSKVYEGFRQNVNCSQFHVSRN